MKLLKNRSRKNKLINELKSRLTETQSNFWFRVHCTNSTQLKSEISRLEKMIKTNMYGDYDPFEKERESLKSQIQHHLDHIHHLHENINSLNEVAENREDVITNLLDYKAKYYSLVKTLKV
jgi:archaellum component FlaC